ncbi:4Fe-4S binding protein [uncultured Phascolarctobacterium sp.]|uniref:4Fe-4S binding protein n=1 Tax=uncultured Phascolarctobacterium sp. TaxID=512296 RepID=UPI0025F9E52E|nr:4Fe-4S binding protein [uncultured Phascolarctobacterium sp.]
MKVKMKMCFRYKRLLGYVLGFVLFYAPFALFQKIIFFIFTGTWQQLTIHSLCLRIQTEHLFDGKLLTMSVPFLACLVILLAVTLFLGPVFCGRLCPAGAFTEYLSKIIPAKLQISWRTYTEIAPLRYGMLAGFAVLPFFNTLLACAYCNFFLFDLFVNYFIFGYFISLTSSMILTLFLWAGLFGLFTNGGRGFCNFLCPVGAVQNLLYSFSRRLPFVYKLKIDSQKCIGCQKCVQTCPMEAMTMHNNKAASCVHNCILCGACMAECQEHAIRYER